MLIVHHQFVPIRKQSDRFPDRKHQQSVSLLPQEQIPVRSRPATQVPNLLRRVAEAMPFRQTMQSLGTSKDHLRQMN